MNIFKRAKEILRGKEKKRINVKVLEAEVLVKDKDGNIKKKQTIINNK